MASEISPNFAEFDCLPYVSLHSHLYPAAMVRVVPIIHRAPPPPRGMIFDAIEPGKTETSVPSTQPTGVANAASKHQRRTYITTKQSSNGLSSSAPSDPSSTNGAVTVSNQKFSLFDYLQELALTEVEFVEKLREEGLLMRVVAGDGNCMFRAVADQVYGDEEMHEQVRACCLDYMEQEADFFSGYVSGDFASYIADKRKLKVYGDHLELQAMAELYNRPVEIRIPGKKTLRICEIEADVSSVVVPLRLSYHNNNHYNSILDPKNPAIGVGLGLPANMKPITEKTLVDAAVSESLKSDAEKQVLDAVVSESLKSETEQQVLDSVTLESAQDQFIDDMLMASALKDSEWDRDQDEALEDMEGIMDDHEHDYNGFLDQQEDDDLEAAIRLSLQESQGHNS